jgi:hypothetical protein
MPTVDDCKRNAEQCLRWADEATNNEIAGLWTQVELSSADPNKVDGAAHGPRSSEAPKS